MLDKMKILEEGAKEKLLEVYKKNITALTFKIYQLEKETKNIPKNKIAMCSLSDDRNNILLIESNAFVKALKESRKTLEEYINANKTSSN